VRYSGYISGLNQGDGETSDYLITLAEEHPGAEAALRKVGGVIEVTKPAKAPQYRSVFKRSNRPQSPAPRCS